MDISRLQLLWGVVEEGEDEEGRSDQRASKMRVEVIAAVRYYLIEEASMIELV